MTVNFAPAKQRLKISRIPNAFLSQMGKGRDSAKRLGAFIFSKETV